MRVNNVFTPLAAAPINLATGTTAKPDTSSPPLYVTGIFVQMKTGGTGNGYVLDGIAVGRTPSTANAGDVTAELLAATSTAPGGIYYDTDANPGGGIDLRTVWIGVAVDSDPVRASWTPKV